MASAFSHAITLDGVPYEAKRAMGQQPGPTVHNLPEVENQNTNAPYTSQSNPQLTPLAQSNWSGGAGATQYGGPTMYDWGENVWTGDEGLLLPGPLVTAVAWPGTAPTADIAAGAFCEYGTDLYVAAGRRVIKLTGGSGAGAAEQDLGGGYQAIALRKFNTSLFVTGASSGKIWELPSGGAWTNTRSGGADVTRSFLASVFWTVTAVTAERLIAGSGNTGLQYMTNASDPRNSSVWTPGSPIDFGPSVLTSLVATRDHVYLGTTQGVRDLDASGLAPNLTPEVEGMEMATNCVATLAMEGWIYYNAGYGLYRVRVANATDYAQVENVTPGANVGFEGPVGGLITALARYDGWVIAAMVDPLAETGGTTWLCWGRQAIGSEPGPLVWQIAPIVLHGYQVTALHVSGLVSNAPRLWIALTNAAGVRSLAWAPLHIQSPYADLVAGRSYRVATSMTLYSSWQTWNRPTMRKALTEIVVESANLGSGANVVLSARTDDTTMYATFGTVGASPRAIVRAAGEVIGSKIKLQIACTGTPTVPPVLRTLELRAIARPDTREVRQYTLRLGSGVRTQGGALDGRDPLLLRTQLERLQQAGRITLRDEWGTSYSCYVASGIDVSEENEDAGHGQGERVLVAVVVLVIVRALGTSFRWGDGTAFGDSGKVYS